MVKKASLIVICIFIISFSIVLQIDRKIQNKEKQKTQLIEPLLRGVSEKPLEIPILEDEEVPVENKITKKPAPVKIVRDLNLITAEAYK